MYEYLQDIVCVLFNLKSLNSEQIPYAFIGTKPTEID